MSEKEIKLEEMIEFIEERGDDGCEFAEFIKRFVDLSNCVNSDYNYGGEEFEKAYIKEAKRLYYYLKDNTRIVEDTETITRTFKRLERKGEDY
jgi:hypothetical protein